MYKGKPQLIIMLVRPAKYSTQLQTCSLFRMFHSLFTLTLKKLHFKAHKRVIWLSEKYMQSLPPGKLQVCQLIQNKVNQDLPRAKKIRELHVLSCLNSKVEFKISFKPCYITYNIYTYLSDTRMQKPATLQAYHGIDNPDNK